MRETVDYRAKKLLKKQTYLCECTKCNEKFSHKGPNLSLIECPSCGHMRPPEHEQTWIHMFRVKTDSQGRVLCHLVRRYEGEQREILQQTED